MNSTYRMALEVLKKRPDIAGNPRAQEMLRVLQEGNAEEGERLANNLLSNYGMTKEQGLEQARSFFGL